jgi:hypothetical protein
VGERACRELPWLTDRASTTERPARQNDSDGEDEDGGEEEQEEDDMAEASEMVEEMDEYTLQAGDLAYIPKQMTFTLTPVHGASSKVQRQLAVLPRPFSACV